MTPHLTTNFISAFGMILVGLAFFLVPKKRLGTGWTPLLLGALTWVVAVALKFAWAMPLNSPIYLGLYGIFGKAATPWAFYVYIGLLTGVFECGVIYLAARFVPVLKRYGADRSLAFGYGFGAVEALLLGLAVLTPVLLAVLAPGVLPEAARNNLGPMAWPVVAAPTLERIATIFVHAFTTWLVFFAVASGRIRYFWAAFVFKSALDAVAAWAQMGFGVNTATKIWTVEAIIMVFGALSVWGLFALGRRWAAHKGKKLS